MNKMATVVGFFEETKGPQIKFDGEEKPAEKEYPYLSSYTPKIDDKIFCMDFGESYIIIGKVNYQEEPFNLDATLEKSVSVVKDEVLTVKKSLETTNEQLETTNKQIETTNKQIEDMLKNIEEKYFKIENFTKEFNTNLNNNTKGKGVCLVTSNMTNVSTNVGYLYVDSHDNTLYVRRTNGNFSKYKAI